MCTSDSNGTRTGSTARPRAAEAEPAGTRRRVTADRGPIQRHMAAPMFGDAGADGASQKEEIEDR
jgi:hypothetical protein